MYKAADYTPEPRNGGSKIPVGIHLATFTGITKEPKWFDVNFSTPNGRFIYKRAFAPSGKQKEGETVAQAIKRQEDANISMLVLLMSIFLDSQVIETFSANSYDQFVDGAIYLLNKSKGAQAYIKVLPDYKDKTYPELGIMSWTIERYSPGVETTLSFSKKESKEIEEYYKNAREVVVAEETNLPY